MFIKAFVQKYDFDTYKPHSRSKMSHIQIMLSCEPQPIIILDFSKNLYQRQCAAFASLSQGHYKQTLDSHLDWIFQCQTSNKAVLTDTKTFLMFTETKSSHCVRWPYVAVASSSVSAGSAPHTWTFPSMDVSRRVSVGWKDSDWTTALPTGSFRVKDPWRSEKQTSALLHSIYASDVSWWPRATILY